MLDVAPTSSSAIRPEANAVTSSDSSLKSAIPRTCFPRAVRYFSAHSSPPLMNSHEAFYVHVQGEQKGPYTLRHLDHLLNSGLIPMETLYWTDGMEQWLPITDLVQFRHKPRNWKRLIILGAILVVLAAFLSFFGTTIADGWRETTQRAYTAEGAYWSARGAVRIKGVPEGAVAQFLPFKDANVTLAEPTSASVLIHGEIIQGGNAKPAAWSVKLSFNPLRSEWSASEVKVLPQ
jgi:hypothetical protein